VVGVTEVAEDIYQLEPQDIGPADRSTVYFIADTETALVETGPGIVATAVVEGMRRLGREVTGLRYIIATHIHLDHAGGVGYLAQQSGGAQVIVHRSGARHFIDPRRLIEGTRAAFGEDFEEEYGPILAVPEEQVFAVDGGETVPLGDRQLQVIYAPGHAPHHIAVFDLKSRGLFCGEGLGAFRPGFDTVMPVAAPPMFELDLALQTMARLKELHPEVLFYSHGTAERDVETLISLCEENTRRFGEVVLESMRAGEDAEALMRRVVKCLATEIRALGRPGASMNPKDWALSGWYRLMIEGYTAYFAKKGLA